MANISDLISEQARLRPSAPALMLPHATLSFADLEALVWRAAAWLHREQIRAGDVVVLKFREDLPILIAMLAIARIGATVFSVPAAAPPMQYMPVLARLGARVVLSDDSRDAVQAVPHRQFSVEDLLRSAIAADRALLYAAHPVAPWLILSGSGSTGEPKMIPLGHAVMRERLSPANGLHPPLPEDRTAVLTHAEFGMAKSRCLWAWSAGASVVLFDRARTNPLLLPRLFGVTVLGATVVHLEQLLASLPADAQAPIDGLRTISVSASTVSDDLRRRVTRALCPNLYVCYGANEIGITHVAAPEHLFAAPGTVGQVQPGVAVEIVDERDQRLPVDTIGQIRLRGPGMIDGYLDDPIASSRAFRDGWFYPGDLGRITADGQLIYCGRADHMMIMDGINIYPAEIEAVVARHPAVRDVAAMPLRSRIHQNLPVCAVSLKPGQVVEAGELLDYARQHLGSRGPTKLVVVGDIPRNAQGKLIRHDLAMIIAHRLGVPLVGERTAPPKSP